MIAYYGEREDSLIKILKGRFELEIEFFFFETIGLIALTAVVIITIVILLILLWKRRKEKDDF